MDFSGQKDHYAIKLADDLLNCCEKKTADFLNMAQYPYYTQDMFTSRVLPDVGQLRTLLDNASRGVQFINYAPTYMIQDSKKDWLKNIKKEPRETGSIVYKGKDENGYKHYEMMTPAGKFNPGIDESPATQEPIPNVGICRQTPVLDPRDPKGMEKYLSGIIGNYFNAAFTKTPYFPPQWGSQETELLSKALNADPSLAIRSSQQAFSQATSVKMENTVNQELNDNVREAMKQGLPPFNTKKQDAIIGPVNINGNAVPGIGVPMNGVPSNGVDFINSYYNSINGKSGAEQGSTTVTQNGYIPYQTHEEKPKNIDKFLVEEYGNIMNASLTGTPYSGSITPAQLKTLSAGVEAKMASDPAYMSGIVNQAHQNVLGFNYMPYDKDDFITRAQDPSSKEYKLLNQTIETHLNDIIKNKKMSFNGEFQELSKDLTEKYKNTEVEKKPSARTTAAKTTPAKTPPPKTTADKTTAPKTTAAKTTAEKTTASKTTASKTTTGGTANGKTTAAKKDEKPDLGTAKADIAGTAKKEQTAGASPAHEVKRPQTRTVTGRSNNRNIYRGIPADAGQNHKNADTVNKEEGPSVNSAAVKTGERPSFVREVSEFVNKNIVEKKSALVLVDTFLGTVVDKAKKIVRTGKTIAAAFVIAANVMAPNLQMPIVDYARTHVPNAVSVSVNQNDFKSAAHKTVKAVEHVRQAAHQVKTAARR
jgi:mannose/fructose-specific phosphotransferase system component IIA